MASAGKEVSFDDNTFSISKIAFSLVLFWEIESKTSVVIWFNSFFNLSGKSEIEYVFCQLLIASK